MKISEIIPGGIYSVAGETGLALAAADADGDVRLVLLHEALERPDSRHVRLEPADFVGATPQARCVLVGKDTLVPAASLEGLVARLTDAAMATVLRHFLLGGVAAFYRFAHAPAQFSAATPKVPVSGRAFDAKEIETLVDASLDFWLTTGRYNDAFEKRFAAFLGLPHALTTNSGSSANLLAVSALTSPSLGDGRLKPGDEVITVAAGFPTTLNPILQNGLIPVFVDAHIPTYNIAPDRIEAAVSDRTRAIILAHTLGNPFDLDAVLGVAAKYGLWVIEDCCDALGARYTSRQGFGDKLVGGFGHIATFSFYPAHHITMGEGGAVATADPKIKKLLESFRDWGRDCWCPPGRDNTCGCRWSWQLGSLPKGYDHKYIYSHIGYNLKITDMQAAVAYAQMDKLPEFIRVRRRNFDHLSQALAPVADRLILPEATAGSEPSWFGFPITLREDCGIDREWLLPRLNEQGIGTRLLFAGNLTRQPYMQGRPHRLAGKLTVSDAIMQRTFWVGVYPALTPDHIEHTAHTIRNCLALP